MTVARRPGRRSDETELAPSRRSSGGGARARQIDRRPRRRRGSGLAPEAQRRRRLGGRRGRRDDGPTRGDQFALVGGRHRVRAGRPCGSVRADGVSERDDAVASHHGDDVDDDDDEPEDLDAQRRRAENVSLHAPVAPGSLVVRDDEAAALARPRRAGGGRRGRARLEGVGLLDDARAGRRTSSAPSKSARASAGVPSTSELAPARHRRRPSSRRPWPRSTTTTSRHARRVGPEDGRLAPRPRRRDGPASAPRLPDAHGLPVRASSGGRSTRPSPRRRRSAGRQLARRSASGSSDGSA